MKAKILLFALFLITTTQAQEIIINDLNPKNFNPDFSEYDQQTSVYCGQLSKVAYWDSLGIQKLHQNLSKTYPKANYRWDFIDHRDRKSLFSREHQASSKTRDDSNRPARFDQ